MLACACQLVPPEKELVGGGGGLSAQNFSAPYENPWPPEPPPPPPTGKILATPLLQTYTFKGSGVHLTSKEIRGLYRVSPQKNRNGGFSVPCQLKTS